VRKGDKPYSTSSYHLGSSILQNIHAVCPWIFILVCSCSFISKDFHLVHADLDICVGSWVAVKPNGTWLPSSSSLGRLRALPSSLPRALRRRLRHAAASLCHFSPPVLQTPTLELLYLIKAPCVGHSLEVFLGFTYTTGTPCSFAFSSTAL